MMKARMRARGFGGPSTRRVLLGALFLAAFLLPSAWADTPTEERYRPAEDEAARKSRFAQRLVAGAGKQTMNQANFDALIYDLDLTMDPTTEVLNGTVTMTAAANGTSIDEVDLDLLDNMTVSGVTMGGSPVTFSHAGDLLTIDLDRTYLDGEVFAVTVEYSGTPNESYGAFGFDLYGGNPMIWSLSEPYGARSWWPCKDIPEDKADSLDFRITVPSDLVVASNGVLRDSTTVSGWTTWWWHEKYPIATYLVSVAAYPYTVFSTWYHYGAADSMEIIHHVFPGNASYVASIVAETDEMITLFAQSYGEYPFVDEKYGHAEFLWGGAMEHQTCSSMGFWDQYVVAHELAHQWFGDQVTCETFNHIWLNEGFAVFSEALWSEHKYGPARYRREMRDIRYFGPGTIYVEDTSNWDDIFSVDLSYNKGAWVVHMLRHVVADDSLFYGMLQAYLSDPDLGYDAATTEEFQAHCEAYTGLDLDAFFDQWIYDEYYPIYSYDYEYEPAPGGYDITLQVDQIQTHRLFQMPIDMLIEHAGGDTTLVVRDSLESQTFVLNVPFEPTEVKLDQLSWILKGAQGAVKDPTFHRGILLVNGVSWTSYGSEITSAYADSAFWGSFDITFWDAFPEPYGGYPANLPTPLGTNSEVPADTMKQFSTVIWVGNNFDGDIVKWVNSSVRQYLDAGGNFVLLSRMGQDFLYPGLRDYLGVTWAADVENTVTGYSSRHPDLIDMDFTGTQSFVALFDTTFASGETELLFTSSTGGATYGAGAWRVPAGGGTHRADGGRLAFLSGRPYRMDHDQLRSNMEEILENFMNEPFDATGVEESGPPKPVSALHQNRPNPFNPTTSIRFTLAGPGPVKLQVYSTSGRLVRTLLDGSMKSGSHEVVWDGRTESGQKTASGVYFYRMEAKDFSDTKKMVLVR